MKGVSTILVVCFAILMIWGCKKDNELAWNDAIAGQYYLNGVIRGSYLKYDSVSGNYYTYSYSDTVVNRLLTIEQNSTSVSVVRTGISPLILDLVQLDADSSIYRTKEGYTTYNIIFRNDDVRSLVYKVSEVTHTSGGSTILEGEKVH